jgi:hypothetical protein
MKKLLFALFLTGLCAIPVPAQQSPGYGEVSDTAALRDLAASYASAYAVLRNETSREITLVLQRQERFMVLKDVRALVASGSVLVASAGSQEVKYLVNPRDVVLVTSSRSLRFDNQTLLNE